MFTSFAIDNGIRFTAHFYDAQADKVETRVVTGWVTGDDGISQATILVADQGIQLRVGQVQGFLAVVPNGQEEQHQGLLDAKVAQYKQQVEAARAKSESAEGKA